MENIEIEIIDDLDEYLENNQRRGRVSYFFSIRGKSYYTQADYQENSSLIFGSETSGLPGKYKEVWGNNFYKIPMDKAARCLNLSNSVAIVVYEALRQTNYTCLSK